MQISVYPVYTVLERESLPGATAVVIDTLRMTSVATVALHNGCAGLRAVCDVEEARGLAARTGSLLGGERKALKIPGFDFSNSPLEFTPGAVRGRRLVMTTTNGTNAIQSVLDADEVFLGCLLNADAVAKSVAGRERLVIALAGTAGRFSMEDAVAAGAIISRLGADCALDDMALASHTLYEACRNNIQGFLSSALHYRRLESLGLLEDLRFCLQEDTVPCVPRLGADGWFHAS